MGKVNMPKTAVHESSGCEACQHRSLRLFCNLTPATLAVFASLGTSAGFPAHATLFHEGSNAANIYVLCTGQVKLTCVSAAGKSMILKVAAPGDVLGLSAVFAGLPYETTAESLEPIAVRCIPRAAFITFLEQFGEASMHAAQSMQSEYRSAFVEARMLALSGSAAGKLAHVLLDWANRAACGKADLRFNTALTHEELASMANLSRETVTRLLGRFQKEKVLAIQGASVTVLKPDQLRELAAH